MQEENKSVSSRNRTRSQFLLIFPLGEQRFSRNKQLLYLMKLTHDKICPKDLDQNLFVVTALQSCAVKCYLPVLYTCQCVKLCESTLSFCLFPLSRLHSFTLLDWKNTLIILKRTEVKIYAKKGLVDPILFYLLDFNHIMFRTNVSLLSYRRLYYL